MGATAVITCQKSHFAIPDDVTYLSAASYSPLPDAVREAGHAGVERKGQPWLLSRALRAEINEAARSSAAALIGADPACVALIPSVSYGITTAATILPVPAGTRVLVLENDHASPVLAWHARADAGAFTVETVATPNNGDWTSAVREAIARPGEPPVSVASLSLVHWADGCALDMAAIASDLRAVGARFVVDATQAVGAMPVDVTAFDPDVLVFPTYKWALGPYGRAFAYIAPRHHAAIPVEQTSAGRRAISSEALPYFDDLEYVDDARRFDMAELDYFISMEMAATGMRFVHDLGLADVSSYIKTLTDALADRIESSGGAAMPDTRFRTAHILSLDYGADRAQDIAAALGERDIHVTARLGRVRVSPHVYNDMDDIERLATALTEIR
jgi:selenocysteine lyase/cysteine desulfurase